MSKNEKTGTNHLIAARALEMFNERGVEYVGLRELAATLNMRVSNITYYFPTKDDLVYRLWSDFSELNSSILVSSEKMTLYSFLRRQQQVFQNQYLYRCLVLSFVHLMRQNNKIAEGYKNTEKKRRATVKNNLQKMKESGSLLLRQEEQIEFLVSSFAFIARFWLSEAAISYSHYSSVKQMTHYLHMLVSLFYPYATAKGRRELEKFQKEIETA